MSISLFINVLHSAYCSIRLDFEFEQLSHTSCKHGGQELETLEDAKDECKGNKQCIGVFQDNRYDDEHYYICLKNATILNDIQIKGSLYKKFPIGKYTCQRFSHNLLILSVL